MAKPKVMSNLSDRFFEKFFIYYQCFCQKSDELPRKGSKMSEEESTEGICAPPKLEKAAWNSINREWSSNTPVCRISQTATEPGNYLTSTMELDCRSYHDVVETELVLRVLCTSKCHRFLGDRTFQDLGERDTRETSHL